MFGEIWIQTWKCDEEEEGKYQGCFPLPTTEKLTNSGLNKASLKTAMRSTEVVAIASVGVTRKDGAGASLGLLLPLRGEEAAAPTVLSALQAGGWGRFRYGHCHSSSEQQECLQNPKLTCAYI